MCRRRHPIFGFNWPSDLQVTEVGLELAGAEVCQQSYCEGCAGLFGKCWFHPSFPLTCWVALAVSPPTGPKLANPLLHRWHWSSHGLAQLWWHQGSWWVWGAGVMLTPPSPLQLPGFCEGSGSVLGVQTHVDCGSFLGHKAVYRMGFAMAAFFFLFALLMVCVRSSKDPRAAVQNG